MRTNGQQKMNDSLACWCNATPCTEFNTTRYLTIRSVTDDEVSMWFRNGIIAHWNDLKWLPVLEWIIFNVNLSAPQMKIFDWKLK